MAGGSLSSPFDISEDADTRDAFRYAETMDKRMKSVMRMYCYVAADLLLKKLLSKLPRSDRWKEYRDSLELAEIPVSGSAAFVVHAKLRARRVKQVDAARTVLYVRGKKKLDKVPDYIQLLEDYGPWTPDTIPFWPDKAEALVIQRQVSKREADKIAKSQERKRVEIRRKLAGMGYGAESAKEKRSRRKRSGKAVPDVAFEALSLEFGAPGIRAVPAWRTSLSEIKSVDIKRAHELYRNISEALFNPRFNRWESWPKVDKKARASDLRDYTGFQIRLGYG